MTVNIKIKKYLNKKLNKNYNRFVVYNLRTMTKFILNTFIQFDYIVLILMHFFFMFTNCTSITRAKGTEITAKWFVSCMCISKKIEKN